MSKTSRDIWLAGVDGCKGGWLAVFVRPDGNQMHVREVVTTFEELLSGPEAPAIITVDMPIGLPNVSEEKGRAPERTVRPLLGARRSSVFRIPSRGAVYAAIDSTIGNDHERYRRACRIARETSVDQKAFALQCFYLCKKIVEVDSLLCKRRGLTERIFETHPEVAFWRLNKRELEHPKSHPEGIKERQCVLKKAGVQSDIVERDPPKGAKRDDLLDAIVCAIVARKKYRNDAKCYPEKPKPDAFGLAMAIWA
jgi:predicted RNase H-like nuclease